ncbi:MAG TPA: hypothetical protein VN939_14525 [Chthoniobacterales bacterium]|nr:hypothetical protein [Chthoniobacterales bacterium]
MRYEPPAPGEQTTITGNQPLRPRNDADVAVACLDEPKIGSGNNEANDRIVTYTVSQIPPNALRVNTRKLFWSLRRKAEAEEHARIAQANSLPIHSGKTKAKPPTTFVRGMEAREMFGSRALLDRAVKAGWLAPVRQGKRMTLYRCKDILAALQRIEWGELG